MELSALEHLKNHQIVITGNMVFPPFSDLISIILAGNRSMHQSLDEFYFRTDLTTDDGVSCP